MKDDSSLQHDALNVQNDCSIHALIQRYAQAADSFSADEFARCFTEDGVLNRPDGEFIGRKAIASALLKQPRKMRRHFFIPPYIEYSSEVEAVGIGYCLLYQQEPSEHGRFEPVAVDYWDEYVKTSEGWRLRRRKVRPSFSA